MKKLFRVSIVRPNVPDQLTLLVEAQSLRKAVKRLRRSNQFQLPKGYYLIQEEGNANNCLATTLIPVFMAHLHISQKEAEVVNGYLRAKTRGKFQSEDNIISHTAVFPDGKQMDIKCCGAQDDCSWTEAVLFDEHGCELCCSEPSDRYDGLWELEYQNRRYAAFVHIHR